MNYYIQKRMGALAEIGLIDASLVNIKSEAEALVVIQSSHQRPLMDAVYKVVNAMPFARGKYWKRGVNQKVIVSTLLGIASPICDYGYTPAAVVLASILNRKPSELFGITPNKMEWRDAATKVNVPLDDSPEIRLALSQIDRFRQDDPHQWLFEQDLRRDMSRALFTLKPRAERLLRRHFGVGQRSGGMTYEEMGDEFICSGQQARQMTKTALRKLRQPSHSGPIWQFLKP